jgi:hypothetical protein
MEKYQMTDDAAQKLNDRVWIGELCMRPVGATDGPDRETTARDAVSDILTALFGPAGYYVDDGAHGYIAYDDDARTNVHEFLDLAEHSWVGDAEDYDATRVEKPLTLAQAIEEIDRLASDAASDDEFEVLPLGAREGRSLECERDVLDRVLTILRKVQS